MAVFSDPLRSCNTATASVIIAHSNRSLPARAAAFGPRINVTFPLLAHLHIPTARLVDMSVAIGNDSDIIASDPELACSSLSPLPAILPNRVALLKRGLCPFISKIRHAQQAGYIAAIVGDDEPDQPLITMFAPGDTSDIQISSLFVSWSSYAKLRLLKLNLVKK